MQITRLGHSCFKIQEGETTVVIDPFNDSIGLKMPKVSTDILLISHNHPDHNNKEAIKGDPFVIDRPGEYEIKDVFVYGIPGYHDAEEGKARGQNLIFLLEIEGVRIAHFGDFGQKSLSEDQLKRLEGVDILLIPVGGDVTIDAKTAAEIISELEPRIVIPMHYQEGGLKYKLDGLDKFKKEIGGQIENLDKLKIKKKDLPVEETKIVVLSPQV